MGLNTCLALSMVTTALAAARACSAEARAPRAPTAASISVGMASRNVNHTPHCEQLIVPARFARPRISSRKGGSTAAGTIMRCQLSCTRARSSAMAVAFIPSDARVLVLPRWRLPSFLVSGDPRVCEALLAVEANAHPSPLQLSCATACVPTSLVGCTIAHVLQLGHSGERYGPTGKGQRRRKGHKGSSGHRPR